MCVDTSPGYGQHILHVKDTVRLQTTGGKSDCYQQVMNNCLQLSISLLNSLVIDERVINKQLAHLNGTVIFLRMAWLLQ